MHYPKNKWVELPPENFARYQTWQTPSGFLCGTYAAAVLLAFTQDQVQPDLLPKTIRTPGEAAPDRLISVLQPVLQPLDLPTIPAQIAVLLNHFLARYSQVAPRVRFTSVGGWYRAVKRITSGQPVMIGLLKLLGSTYGNHWVVAYGFYENERGERFFKIHDNWGHSDKIIPASWVNGTISFTPNLRF